MIRYVNSEAEMQKGYQIFKCLLSSQNINKGSLKIYNFFWKYNRKYCECRFKAVTRKVEENNLKIMRVDSPWFKNCITEEVLFIKNLFEKIGHEIRIVGGAVRDLLLGTLPKDLDFSTTATPEEMKTVFTENNIRLINKNGERHGTITVLINDKVFEITTLRVDIATDGRHAKVQFTKNWLLDANRRDLTINAMYLGLDGTLYDYFNGFEDLTNRRVVFVGSAEERIKEDYLRILRYFRFYGIVADTPDNHDEDVLKAIQENAHGLKIVSGERILIELQKLLNGRFAGHLLQKILSLNIGSYIGLPEKPNINELVKVCDKLKLKELKVVPMTLLSAVMSTEKDVETFCARVKPSTFERELMLFIVKYRHDVHLDQIKFYQILVIKTKKSKEQMRSYVLELIKYQGKSELIQEFNNWKVPVFPIKGNLLESKGIYGKRLGKEIEMLREKWIESDFTLSAEKLLDMVPSLSDTSDSSSLEEETCAIKKMKKLKRKE